MAGLVLALASTAALADAPQDVRKMATDDCAKARAAGKTCVISIEGIDVEGKTGTAGLPPIVIPPFDKSLSLIKIRKDFIREIMKTAEDI